MSRRRRQHDAIDVLFADRSDVVVHAGDLYASANSRARARSRSTRRDDLDAIVAGEHGKQAGFGHGTAADDDDTKWCAGQTSVR